MRDWFEQHLRRVLRERVADIEARPLSIQQVRHRARRVAVGYAVAALVLVACLAALLLID